MAVTAYYRSCNCCNALLLPNVVDEPYCNNCGCPEYSFHEIPLMKYMVVFWESERREYVILHYSHHYGECEKRFLELKKQYPTCQLMFDYNDLSMSEAREKFKAMQKEINDKIAAMKCPQLNLGVLTEEYEDAED